MRIAIGADHAGFLLKEELRSWLDSEGHTVRDFGTASAESTDYPDYARLVGESVARGEADYGILVCSTGVGMSIAANKIRGVRAALGVNEEEVTLARSHNNANVLTLGARYLSADQGKKLAGIFLSTEFSGGRHARRVDKIAALEA